MAMLVTIPVARELMEFAIRAGKVPFLKGSPGVGKSAIVREIAKVFNLKLIDLRLSQCDPTDLMGYPDIYTQTFEVIDGKTGERKTVTRRKATYAPFDTFPLEGDPIPKGYAGWLLFLDEFNGADVPTQKASYKVALDKMVGQEHLHAKCVVMCAGNLDTDMALVEEMSTALQSRLIHITATSNAPAWLDWAATAKIDPRITAFINFKPGALNTFDPQKENTEETYACERTWVFVNDLLKQLDDISNPLLLPLLAGALGEGSAREFIGYLKVFADLPTIQDIINDPAGTAIPDQPSTIYAVAGSLSHNADADNVEALMIYINRLPAEYQVLCIQEMVKRSPKLFSSPAIVDWSIINNKELV